PDLTVAGRSAMLAVCMQPQNLFPNRDYLIAQVGDLRDWYADTSAADVFGNPLYISRMSDDAGYVVGPLTRVQGQRIAESSRKIRVSDRTVERDSSPSFAPLKEVHIRDEFREHQPRTNTGEYGVLLNYEELGISNCSCSPKVSSRHMEQSIICDEVSSVE